MQHSLPSGRCPLLAPVFHRLDRTSLPGALIRSRGPGELDLAQRFDENLLRLSHQRNDSAGLVLGHHSSGRPLFYRGRFVSLWSHQEEALKLYDPIFQCSRVVQAGFDPCVGVQGYLALALLCLGFPDRALAQSNAAIAEAWRLANPPSLAVGLLVGARLFSLFGDNAALDERAGELIAVAIEQGFPYWRTLGTAYRGPQSKMATRWRGFRCFGSVRPLTVPPGQRRGCPKLSRCWLGRARSQDKLKRP